MIDETTNPRPPHYEFHPLANLFPLIEGEEFDRLCEDIKFRGFIQKIAIYEGKILDGRNRYRAGLRVGADFRFAFCTPNFRDHDEVLRFVAAHNLLRRHLSPPQRAMIAAEMANMRVGGNGSNQHSKSNLANLRICSNGDEVAQEPEPPNLDQRTEAPQISQAKAAEIMGASARSVSAATAIKDHGVPELAEAVRSGQMSINAASAIAKLPEKEQREAVAERTAKPAGVRKKTRGEDGAFFDPAQSQTPLGIMLRAWGKANSFQREAFLREATPSVADILNGMKQTTEAGVSNDEGGK